MCESGAHILVFPYPAQGHMIPLLDFTRHLATRGLTITILVTPKNLPLLNPLLAAHHGSITPLVLPFPAHPAIPPGVENSADLPDDGFVSMLSALSELRKPITDWFRNHPSPPVAVVSDMFLGWTHHLACQLSIRRYAFFPSGAFAMSFVYFLWRETPVRNHDHETVGSTEIPNSPVYPWWQVSPVFRSYVKGDPNLEFIKDLFLANFASYGLAFNTFDGLERIYLDYLVKKLGHDRIWPIGPLLPPDADDVNRGGPTSVVARSWLDTCDDHTVLYVCFGSQTVLTEKQMTELTLGLEKSGVKFILAVKGGEGDYGTIPQGFEDRVNGRGVVIKGWAPQVSILRHKAVCAFLTHCGWNSALESILSGIPMLAWPMSADQFLNTTLLVDQLDIAVRVCEGDDAVLHSDDLVKILDEIGSDEWMKRRNRAVALSKTALDDIRSGGISFKNLDEITRCLSQKC